MNHKEVVEIVECGGSVAWSRESNIVVEECGEWFVQVPDGRKVSLKDCNPDGFFIVDEETQPKPDFVGATRIKCVLNDAMVKAKSGVSPVCIIAHIADQLRVKL